MKKIILVILVLILTGCDKNDYITCKINVDNKVQNYNMDGTYKIYYNDNYVTKIDKLEKYISSDKSMIDYFYESKNLEYYNLKDLYNGVEYKINSNEKSVNIDVKINMNLVDIKNMVKNGYLDKNYVISNKLTKSGIIKIYESKGAVCDI